MRYRKVTAFRLATAHANHRTECTDFWLLGFEHAKDFFEENGSYDRADERLESWITTTRNKWRRGTLPSSEYKRLKKIKFPFTDTRSSGPSKGRGKKLDVIMTLKKEFDTGIDLTNDQKKILKQGLGKYLSAYNGGTLSKKSATILGFI